jgi:hypothetical protein
MASLFQAGLCSIDPPPTHCQEFKWPRGAGFAGSAAGQGPYCGRGRRRGPARVPDCCGRAPGAGLQRDGIPLCTAMPRFHSQAFRALVMIVASSGLYLAVSGHDHETARAEGPKFLAVGPSRVDVPPTRCAVPLGLVWDLDKTPLSGGVPQSLDQDCAIPVANPGGPDHGNGALPLPSPAKRLTCVRRDIFVEAACESVHKTFPRKMANPGTVDVSLGRPEP